MDRTFASQLAQLCPSASKTIIAGIVDNARLLDQAGINTPIRLRHFFARVCVETGGLRSLEENLSYTAERARQVWPSRFPTVAAAKPFAKNPAKLAEKVYGGRLGNFKPGDGYTYRGSGLLQNTGRANFEEVEAATGLKVVANPELLRSFPGALQAATIYWTKRNISALADKNDTAGVCKAVNGGSIGLADQKTWLARAAKVWPDGTAIIFPAPQAAPPAPVPVPQMIPDKPAVVTVTQPDSGPPVITVAPALAEPVPTPSGSSGGTAVAVVAVIAVVGSGIATFWHHITNLFWSIF